jgi:maleylpyruvate isomerase
MNEASHSLDRLAAATGRLLATATALGDAQAREPSLLPGWTRGHVLSHIARNADGMVNLLNWARTGTETPMYASAESAPHGYRIGPAGTASPPIVVRGQPDALLAWLLGRGSGAGLGVSGEADGPPVLPAWR